jgi:hypothetical protein
MPKIKTAQININHICIEKDQNNMHVKDIRNSETEKFFTNLQSMSISIEKINA